MNRYVLAIKREYASEYSRDDVLHDVNEIADLEVVGGTGLWLVVRATPQAIGQAKLLVSRWCSVEEEITFRPSADAATYN